MIQSPSSEKTLAELRAYGAQRTRALGITKEEGARRAKELLALHDPEAMADAALIVDTVLERHRITRE